MNEDESRFQPAKTIPDRGRILALDLGSVDVGVAVCDEHRITVRRLLALHRTSWKKLVLNIKQLCRDFDAQAVVIGLPLNMDGTSGNAAQKARIAARNLEITIQIPVYLQDERLTSVSAASELRDEGLKNSIIEREIHSHSAAIILRDFLLAAEPINHDIILLKNP